MKKIFLSAFVAIITMSNTMAQNVVKNNFDAEVTDEVIQKDLEETSKNAGYSKLLLGEVLMKGDNKTSSMGLSYGVELGGIRYITPNVPLYYGLGYLTYSKSKNGVRSNAWSLRVPVNIGYKIKAGNFSIVPRVGPYADWEIYGKDEMGIGRDKIKAKHSDAEGFHAVTFGANAALGVSYKGIGIYAEYGYALTERFENCKQNYWAMGLILEL